MEIRGAAVAKSELSRDRWIWVGVGLMALMLAVAVAGEASAALKFAEGLIALAGGSILYVLPSIVAFRRDHCQKAPILALNVLLGWAIIGWVAAMVWALIED